MKRNVISRMLNALVSELPLSLALYILFLIPSFLPPKVLYNELRYQHSLALVILAQPLFYVVVLSLLSHRYKWVWWCSLAVVGMLTMVDIGCYISQGINLTSVLLALILQTNFREACEFLSNPVMMTGLLSGFLGLGIFVAAVHMADRMWKRRLTRIKHRATNVSPVVMNVIGVTICLVSLLSAYMPYRIMLRNNMGDFVKADHCVRPIAITSPFAYYFIELQRRRDALQVEGIASANSGIDLVTCDVDSLNIILVIGESHNKHRCNLYGYQKQTYPLMTKLAESGNLTVFNDIITYMGTTKSVIPRFFTPLRVHDSKPYDSAPLLPAILKKGGYETAIFCNQQLIKTFLLSNQSCYLFLNSEEVRDQCFDKINETICKYDADFVAAYPPPVSSPRNFTIYNLMGQHYVASERYPAEFAIFKPDEYTQLHKFNDTQYREMSEYDNACLYNDYVLNEIIKGVADEKAVVIYVPDHAEESYDYRTLQGRRLFEYTPATIKCEYEVPMFIWCSDKFIQESPDAFRQLKANVDKALYNTDIAHTIMDLSGVRTSHYDPRLSLLTDSVLPGHRYVGIYSDYDYDANRDIIKNAKLIYE